MDQQQHVGTKRQKPQLTTDAVIIHNGKVLLITRGKDPFKGRYAFPGGHLDYNEDPVDCCLRELKEETGLTGLNAELLDVKGHPLRDPRGHYVSIVYKVMVSENEVAQAGDDAATVQWVDVEEALKNGPDQFAFDHYEILVKACQK